MTTRGMQGYMYLLRSKYEARDALIKYKNEVENQLRKQRDLDLVGEKTMSPKNLWDYSLFLKI